jgi:hypothetical protein
MKFAILFSLIFASACGHGVLQEVILHESDSDNVGNSYIFRRGVPDLSIYPFLGDIVRFCHNSRIELYSNINYEGSVSNGHPTGGCHEAGNTTAIYKSFRFFGNKDTSVDAVSLFPDSDLRGVEILVDRSPFGGITQGIKSLAYSGTSSWTLFEGSNFSGKTTCLPAGSVSNTLSYSSLSALNITTVGSLFKGCLTTVTSEMRANLRRQAMGM